MKKLQLDLFDWATSRPTAKVIDAMPALIRKAAMEVVYQIPNKSGGKIIPLGRKAA
ncbi:MAG: hypothetical protein KL863_07515 [Rhizobium sp.]|nr:hypothetical protein [Rhizobium sp.]